MSIREKLTNFSPEFMTYKIMDKSGYGYEIGDPIMVKSAESIYEIIRRMKLADPSYQECSLGGINHLETFHIQKFNGFVDHMECAFKVVKNGERCLELYDLYFCVNQTTNKKLSKTEIIMGIYNLDDIILPEEFILS